MEMGDGYLEDFEIGAAHLGGGFGWDVMRWVEGGREVAEVDDHLNLRSRIEPCV